MGVKEGLRTEGSLDLAIQIQEGKADDQMDALTDSLKMPGHEERVHFTCSPLPPTPVLLPAPQEEVERPEPCPVPS